ncbi:ABC transporter substrate-binding protein [Neptuniibacter sp.]|uniref:ABC transporter substrate-binding protein n=1 Tax=Neptuniibacter sp. TaxID=1962643 RepID=UPI002616BAA6|nr:ABC transporter substrate-binding protein [Neptuniibacter sp.]MCP4598018.1 amino acid ABC transporter substrate-binding protein [Neptuniibacter sp.]
MRLSLRLVLLSGLLLLIGCSDPEPIKIGFIGGTSGRVADLGIAGRNGFLLAVEQQNKRGGIDGHPIEVILKDDQQNPEVAKKGISELLNANVDAVIGPMTSAMAMATVDQMNKAETVMMACTVTTDKLTALDDYFLRPLSAINSHSAKAAKLLTNKHPEVSQLTIVIDLGNEAYTRDWANGFNSEFTKNASKKVISETFASSNDTDFSSLADSIIGTSPEAVVLVMNSVDAALLNKQLKQIKPNLVMLAAEWAGTERLIELGGSYVEGLYVAQYINRESETPRFIKFKNEYLQRFQQEPGFPAMYCYNSATMVMAALKQRKSGHSLKQSLLALNNFQGVQGVVAMDRFGDTQSITYMTQIKNGQFVVMGE